jgi:hypothetical protein
MTRRIAIRPAQQWLQWRPRRRPCHQAVPVSAGSVGPRPGASRQQARLPAFHAVNWRDLAIRTTTPPRSERRAPAPTHSQDKGPLSAVGPARGGAANRPRPPGQAPSPSGTRPVRESVTRLAGDRPLGAKDAAPAGGPSQGATVGSRRGAATDQCDGGRGGARRLRGVCAAEVGEDGAHDRGVLHSGDDPQPAATAGTGEDIEIEHAAHQRGPGPRARGGADVRTGLDLGRLGGRGRAAVADDVRAPARMRGENAVIQNQVDRGEGMMAASFSRNSIGSKSRCEVPSCHTVLSSTRTRPAPRRRTRFWARGGRLRAARPRGSVLPVLP